MVPLELVANLTTRQNQGGLISDSKNFVVVFAVILWGKNEEFSGKGGGVTPIRKVCCEKAHHSFPKRGRGEGEVVRGRLKVLRKFIQNGPGKHP